MLKNTILTSLSYQIIKLKQTYNLWIWKITLSDFKRTEGPRFESRFRFKFFSWNLIKFIFYCLYDSQTLNTSRAEICWKLLLWQVYLQCWYDSLTRCTVHWIFHEYRNMLKITVATSLSSMLVWFTNKMYCALNTPRVQKYVENYYDDKFIFYDIMIHRQGVLPSLINQSIVL